MTFQCPECPHAAPSKRSLGSHIRWNHPDYDALSGSVEGVDYVTCKMCGFRGKMLVQHLPLHGISQAEYADQFPGSPTHATKTLEAFSASHPKKTFPLGPVSIPRCSVCGDCFTEDPVAPCLECQERRANPKWEGLLEGRDYVSCHVCGFRARSLGPHLQQKHPEIYRDYERLYPGARVLCETVRNKRIARGKSRKGVPQTEEWKRKQPDQKRHLTREEFAPYAMADGTIDHWKMAEGLKIGQPIIERGLLAHGLKRTDYYAKNRTKACVANLSGVDFEPFKLKNGKVAVAKAVKGLKLNARTVQNECKRRGLQVAFRCVAQELCLDVVSTALGGLPYVQEWGDARFKNSKTGGRYRYDGSFLDRKLLVEFHGKQHYQFPNHRTADPAEHAETLRRDKEKTDLAAEHGYRLLTLLEDDPWEDLAFVRGKLAPLGL